MRSSLFSRLLGFWFPALAAAVALCAVALGSPSAPVASAQMPAMPSLTNGGPTTPIGTQCAGSSGPGIAVGATLVGTTVVATYIGGSYGTCAAALPASAVTTTLENPGPYAATGSMPLAQSGRTMSGQYCADKSGGQIWISSGAPTEGLTCPSATGQ